MTQIVALAFTNDTITGRIDRRYDQRNIKKKRKDRSNCHLCRNTKKLNITHIMQVIQRKILADYNNRMYYISLYTCALKISFMLIMCSIPFIGIITALTIVATTIASFGFILATAQTTTYNNNTITGGDNTTSGNSNTTKTDQVNQTGSIARN
jgi:hypothetical protein